MEPHAGGGCCQHPAPEQEGRQVPSEQGRDSLSTGLLLSAPARGRGTTTLRLLFLSPEELNSVAQAAAPPRPADGDQLTPLSPRSLLRPQTPAELTPAPRLTLRATSAAAAHEGPGEGVRG